MKVNDTLKTLKSLRELKEDKQYNKYLMFSIIKAIKDLEDVEKIGGEKELALYTESYKLFQDSRLSLLKVYGKRNENGEIITENNQVVIQEDKRSEFEVEITKLLDANKETIETFNEGAKELDAWLLEDVEISFKKVSIDKLPEEITKKEYEVLSLFVED